MQRRQVLGAFGLGAFAALAPWRVANAAQKRVVVVGGGMAGATVAKYLRLWSGGAVDVTLVESDAKYVSNIMSNLVVTGQLAPSVLDFNWSKLGANRGVRVVRGSALAVVPGSAAGTWAVKLTRLGVTTTLECERVVLAPGVMFDALPSLADPAVAAPVLHAWQAGPQTLLLRDRLAAMPSSGTYVFSIPKAPYRCPPGPYERACLVADFLARKKPGARIVVLDANPDIVAERENFSLAFNTMYAGNLVYRPGRVVKAVDAVAGQPGGSVVVNVMGKDANGADIVTGTETWSGELLNLIPPHRAGAIVQKTGLADATGFAPVDGRSFESTVAGKAGIHVIGDASRTTLPKAGHVGNQEAKICADAILRAFAGQAPYATPVANSACFSPLGSTKASWLTAVYQYQQDASTGAWRYVATDQVAGTTGPTEALAPSTASFSRMGTWYRSLMADSFS